MLGKLADFLIQFIDPLIQRRELLQELAYEGAEQRCDAVMIGKQIV